MSYVPIFLYGSLRPGHALWRNIEPAVFGKVSANLPGYNLHYHRCGAYPVMVADPERLGTVVIGTLAYMDEDHPAVQATVMMELMAGYNAEWVRVKAFFPALDECEHDWTEALAFVYRDEDYGDLVPGNDWNNNDRRPWPMGK